MKRDREEFEEGDASAEAAEQPAASEPAPAAQEEEAADDEDDQPLITNYRMSRSVRKGAECPYLDTISRQVPPPPAASAAHTLHVIDASPPPLIIPSMPA